LYHGAIEDLLRDEGSPEDSEDAMPGDFRGSFGAIMVAMKFRYRQRLRMTRNVLAERFQPTLS